MSEFRLFSARDKYPCRDFPDGICPNRVPGCQDKCPAMIEAKRKIDERKRIERQRREESIAVNECQIVNKCKASRKKRREL